MVRFRFLQLWGKTNRKTPHLILSFFYEEKVRKCRWCYCWKVNFLSSSCSSNLFESSSRGIYFQESDIPNLSELYKVYSIRVVRVKSKQSHFVSIAKLFLLSKWSAVTRPFYNNAEVYILNNYSTKILVISFPCKILCSWFAQSWPEFICGCSKKILRWVLPNFSSSISIFEKGVETFLTAVPTLWKIYIPH